MFRRFVFFCLLATFQAHAAENAAENAADSTATGIALDTSWKQLIYRFAQKNVVHPSWGSPILSAIIRRLRL